MPVIPLRLANLPEFKNYLQPVIAQDKVRYVGEPMAVVVAETQGQAEDALEKIELDIERLPALPDRHAAAADKSLLFEAAGSNRAVRYTASFGDADAAFAKAEYTRKETFRCHRLTGLPLETRGQIAEWNAGRLTVFGATKVLFFNRRTLAPMLGVTEAEIDMIEVDVGGGFGVKGEFYPEDFLIPFAARMVGRPVKWIEDRREHLVATNHSREVDCELEIACTRDGKILAMRGHVAADMGAYIRTNGGVVPAKAAQFLPGPYRIRDIALTVEAFVTSKTPVGTLARAGTLRGEFLPRAVARHRGGRSRPRSDGISAEEPDRGGGAAVPHRQACALRARDRFRHRRLSRDLRAGGGGDRLGEEQGEAGQADRRPLSRARGGAVRRERRLGQGELPRSSSSRTAR